MKTLRKPPIAMANVIKDVRSLFEPKIAMTGIQKANLHFSFQLNGYPHLGTITSVATAFKTGQIIANMGINEKLTIEVLENAPALQNNVNKICYSLLFSDYYIEGKKVMDNYLNQFYDLFNLFSEWSGVDHEILFYQQFQENQKTRQKLSYVLKNYDSFSRILAPHDKIIRVRIKCPVCNYVNKDSKNINITTLENEIQISSYCPEHGEFSVILNEDNYDFIDMNTPLRNVIKESLFIENAITENALNVMVDGADWVYITPLIEQGLGLFGHNISQLPIRVFSPLIIDDTGAKFSKSIHMKGDNYPEISETIKNIGKDIKGNIEYLKTIWDEVDKWVNDPFLLFRDYSISYFNDILGGLR